MCKVTNTKFYSAMDHGHLLDLAASDDINGFVSTVEEKGLNLDAVSFWYGRTNSTTSSKRKMGFAERTPLMIASVYGSIHVIKYLLLSKKVDVNKPSGSDGATALHCAVSGGSPSSVEVVKLLLEASADVNLTDVNGNKPVDLIARGIKIKSSTRRRLEMLLKGVSVNEEKELMEEKEEEESIVVEKKEYPVDASMPDINNGVYGSDEFRMYTFKVKPCSRAYTHDWTECPFVHPGENARRRDLRKFSYSCVPCPEFRKGSCGKGDACEYAHGVFESWLHPAQYKTRLCKDETGCARKVCFFAHRVEELRPVYASTGSALPSPKSGSGAVTSMSMEMGSMSPLGLGTTMSPPGSPLWQNKVSHLTPPALQLPGSRLKTSLNARDLAMDKVIDDLSNNLYNNSNNSSSNRFGEMIPTNLEGVFGSPDQSLMSQFHGLLLSPKVSNTQTLLQSPTSHNQFHQNSNPLRASYPSPNYSSSPVRKPASYGFDSSAAVAQAVMNARSSSLKQRSLSFIDRAMNLRSIPQQSSEWGAPDGKLDWGFGGEDASKLRKSASFGYGGVSHVNVNVNEPDVSWVNTLVKDVGFEQMYIEQEQMVA